MRKLVILFLAVAFTLPSFGQADDQNDPKAKKILDRLKADYENLKTCSMDFKLTIEIPEENAEIQEGSLLQKGDKYKVELKEQAIYCDGESIRVHLKNNNEVQINDMDFEDENMLSPKELMKLYESGEYIYMLSFVGNKDGISVQQIEFKPVDPDSEYSKMRMTIDKKEGTMRQMKVFSKDGSKFTMDIEDMVSNQSIDENAFVFDSSKFPGIHIEDLRID